MALEPYPFGATDFRAQLARVAAAAPDVVIPLGYEGETVAMIRQGVEEFGLESLWGPATKAVETPRYYSELDDLAPFTTVLTYFTIYDSPRGEAGHWARRFRRDFPARWNQPGSFRSANQYDSLYLLKRAIERAQSFQNTRLRAALNRLDMPQLTLPTRGGRIRFDRFREVRFIEFVAQLYRDPASGENRSRIVWPDALATAAFELPGGP